MKRHLSLAFSAMTVLAVLVASTAVKAQEQIGGEINILSWGGYIDFALPGFEEKYGVKINIDYYGDEKEAMNKIRTAGLGTHDVVFLGAGFEDIAIKQGLIVPLDLKKLPAFEDVFPVLKKTKADGHIYCATYAFGLNSLIVYDPAKTGGPITSWADVYSGKYEGRIGKIDKADEQVWRTAISLNYKFGQLSEEQWAAVEARMVENTKQVRTVYSHNDQMAQLLANGEIWIADSDDGSYRQAKAKGLKIDVTYPEEGLTAWYDGPCIVAQAENEKAAYAFINYMVGAEVQASLPKELGYAPANKKGVEMVDAKTNADMGLDDLVKNIDKIQFKYDLGADFTNRAAEVWERAKAAAGK